jgi:hypothetical protein
MEFNHFLIALTTDWVALMSGIASVILAIIGVAKKWERVPPWVFWWTAIICFFVSSIRVWTTEHRTRLAAELKNTPNLLGDIEFASVFPKDLQTDADTVVLLFARIVNDGAPSFADVKEIKIILRDGRELQLVSIGVPANGVSPQSEPGKPGPYFPARDYLPIKALSQPIPTGGAVLGWTWGLAEGATKDEVNDPATMVILAFTDIKGKYYESRKSLSDAKVRVIDSNSLQSSNP